MSEHLNRLVDNAVDCGKIKRANEPINVSIDFDIDVGEVRIHDDAGGMNLDDMKRCMQLGGMRTNSATKAGIIGRYGMGAKEATNHSARKWSLNREKSQAPACEPVSQFMA